METLISPNVVTGNTVISNTNTTSNTTTNTPLNMTTVNETSNTTVKKTANTMNELYSKRHPIYAYFSFWVFLHMIIYIIVTKCFKAHKVGEVINPIVSVGAMIIVSFIAIIYMCVKSFPSWSIVLFLALKTLLLLIAIIFIPLKITLTSTCICLLTFVAYILVMPTFPNIYKRVLNKESYENETGKDHIRKFFNH